MTTTNYFDTLITVADDCPSTQGEVPPLKGDTKTAANLQFEMLYEHPYEYSSDDVLFRCHAIKKEIQGQDLAFERGVFFSKGQACMRASALTKRYGWGVHANQEGKIAIVGRESDEYQKLLANANIKKVKAMRASRG